MFNESNLSIDIFNESIHSIQMFNESNATNQIEFLDEFGLRSEPVTSMTFCWRLCEATAANDTDNITDEHFTIHTGNSSNHSDNASVSQNASAHQTLDVRAHPGALAMCLGTCVGALRLANVTICPEE